MRTQLRVRGSAFVALRSRWLLACIACVSRETRCDSRCFKMSERMANMKSWDPFQAAGYARQKIE